MRENLTVAYIGKCRNINECNPSIQCSTDYHPLCASNLEEYSNECEMTKYACQSNIRLTKLHDGPCDFYEQQQQLEGNRIYKYPWI